MKKILIMLGVVVLLGLVASKASADSYWYSNTISTYVTTDVTGSSPTVRSASCKIQQVTIYHITASTATYIIYTSTAAVSATRTKVATIYLPATAGIYTFPSPQILSSGMTTGSDLISMPYFYIRHADGSDNDTRCATDTVQIIYKK